MERGTLSDITVLSLEQTTTLPSLTWRLAQDAFKNDQSGHIRPDQSIHKECRERFCLYPCPAPLYSLNEETGQMQVEFAGCLECGTCMIACIHGSAAWNYPRGDFGVQYPYG